MQELRQNKDELLHRVSSLRTELTDWRGKLDEQMDTYRRELGELRSQLGTEVDDLREQFAQLQTMIRSQLDATRSVAEAEGSVTAKEAIPAYKGVVAQSPGQY